MKEEFIGSLFVGYESRGCKTPINVTGNLNRDNIVISEERQQIGLEHLCYGEGYTL